MLKNHPEYETELQRLQQTKAYMEEFIHSIKARQQQSTGEIREAFVDLDYLDSSQSYITILVNARYLDRSRESLDKVFRAKAKPYFSRIDFREAGEAEGKPYYIGKLSLFNEKHKPLIIDWRAPIASVYYDSRLGDVSYEAEEGTIKGELLLKRHYTIEQGELQDFFDEDITTADELLLASLRGSADERLKDIVTTIQAEQNKIIRASMERPLIVQGVAGSGKTTIALHRIAYLIYTYEKTFKPQNFMIIAPNKLFLNYISDVLPELGADEVRQTTFPELCYEMLKLKYKLIPPEEKLVTLLEADEDPDEGPNEVPHKAPDKGKELLKWASRFKGSMAFLQLLDNYLDWLERDLLPPEPAMLETYPVMSAAEIEEKFTHELNYLPLYQRLPQLKKKLNHRIKQKKKDIIEDVTDASRAKIDSLKSFGVNPELVQKKVVALLEKKDSKVAALEKSARTMAANYLKKFRQPDTLTCYRELLTDRESLLKHAPQQLTPEQVNYLCETAELNFAAKKVELEDLAPLLYLKSRLEGFKEQLQCKYVVVDEAQDFSLLQFHVLKHVLQTSNFTVLGDLSQGIHAYRGITNWQDVSEQIFAGQSNFLTLEQSYRTTIEIMELANKVLQQGNREGDDLILAKPVVRHGTPPQIKTYTQKKELAAGVWHKLDELKEQGYTSVAIIGKTLPECNQIKKLLQKQRPAELPLLTGNEDIYQAGVMVVPAYATKGLEFDGVLIVNLEERYLENELDSKLLYVAMTRAMHSLFIFAMEDIVTSVIKV